MLDIDVLYAAWRGLSTGGLPSFIACLIWSRSSGGSGWLWTATACWTAASSNSFSISALLGRADEVIE
jgi:hypothetical protein